jgi:hypothetical protein
VAASVWQAAPKSFAIGQEYRAVRQSTTKEGKFLGENYFTEF